jgi:hypothetical protein
VALKSLNADLGPFDPIVRRCLQKDKERRYPDARELRMDLLGVIERARASQRDHLGSWIAGILDKKGPSSAGATELDGDGSLLSTGAHKADKTQVENLDPFAHPHDPGLDLPENPDFNNESDVHENGPLGEQATRLKTSPGRERPAPSGTVLKPAGRQSPATPVAADEVESGVSHVTGLRKGPSSLLFGVLGAVAVLALAAVLYKIATREPPRLPETAADQPGAAAPTPPAGAVAPAPTPTGAITTAAVPAPAPTGSARPAENPSQPPTAAAAAAVAVPTPTPIEPLPEIAAVEPEENVHHSARRRKSPAGEASAPPATAGPQSGGGLLVKAIGDTHASDAYGNPLNPHHSMGPSANLQVGNLLVQVKSAMNAGERTISITSEPWAIASVDGVSRGKTPLASIPLPDHGVRVELIRPGMDSAAVLKISPSGN